MKSRTIVALSTLLMLTKYLIADNDNATEERIGGIGSTGKGK